MDNVSVLSRREEWASECCLTPSEQIVREQDAFNEMAMMSALNWKRTRFIGSLKC
jgi:hypothetical protein